MNLIFVRHGQSIWNLENKFTGWVDVELSEIISKYNEENYLLPGSDVLSPRIENKLNDLEVKWTKGVFYKTVISDLSDLKNVYYDILVFFKIGRAHV